MAFVIALARTDASPALPNILFILADDLGYSDTSLYGPSVVDTPNIDSIASDGVLFRQGYVTSPVCGPSRASLMVSLYPGRMGMINNTVGDDHLAEIPSGQTIASLLKAKGYQTAAIGKWHLGGDVGLRPASRGFDQFFGFYGGRSSYYPTNAPAEAVHLDADGNVHFGGTITVFPGQGIVRNGTAVTENSHLTDAFTREALAYIDANAGGDQPFFLYLAYNAPHNPIQCPRGYYDKFPGIANGEERVYAGMIDQLDESIGRVLARLTEKGIADDTIVIFLSDNGAPTGGAGVNTPLRGGKYTVYEGGVRVPFVIKWPGNYPAGRVIDTPVSSLDLLPTLAAKAGYTQDELAATYAIDGHDLTPLVQALTSGGTPGLTTRSEAFCWSYLTEDPPYQLRSGARDGNYKYVTIDKLDGNVTEALYDLSVDIGENNNLIGNAAYADTLARIKTTYADWDAAIHPPTPVTIAVDFSTNEFFPLVKERIGLLQETEAVPDEQTLLDRLPLIADLPPTSFSARGRFAETGPFNRFNDPPQIYGESGAVLTRVDPRLDAFFQDLRARRITPVMSWFGTPAPLQGTGGLLAPPADSTLYGNTLAALADRYAQGGNLVLEIGQEPDLDQFFNSTDNAADYWSVFNATAAAAAKNRDLQIAAPAASANADDAFYNTFVTDYLAEKQRNPDLPLDYFSFHVHGDPTTAAASLAARRNEVKGNFNTVPFLLTEYTNDLPGDTTATRIQRDGTTGAVRFLRHVKMLTEQTDVAAANWSRFMADAPAVGDPLPGGLLDEAGVRQAIFNAFQLYGWLPVDRNHAAVSDTTGDVDALAASDLHNAGVLIWNSGATGREVTLDLSQIPASIREHGYLRLYRIDHAHASAAEGAPDVLSIESEQTIDTADFTTTFTLAGPGICYLRLDDGTGISSRGRRVLATAKYVRSWQFCPRTASGGSFVLKGNYGTFDPAAWILRVGTAAASGKGIAGVTMDDTPSRLWIRYTSRDVALASGNEIIMALRLDYWSDGAWVKSVLLHGDAYKSGRTENLPWGKGGASGDEVVDLGSLIGNGRPFAVDVDAHAPDGWKSGPGRRCLVSAWTQGTGAGSQSVITLSDGADSADYPLEDWDGDGRANLLEIALGTDPLQIDSTGDALRTEGAHLVFRHLRSPGFEYRVQYSQDLKSWATIWTSAAGWDDPAVVSRIEQNTFDTITIQNPAATADTRGFWRLEIAE